MNAQKNDGKYSLLPAKADIQARHVLCRIVLIIKDDIQPLEEWQPVCGNAILPLVSGVVGCSTKEYIPLA
jgi:hypothetical protein